MGERERNSRSFDYSFEEIITFAAKLAVSFHTKNNVRCVIKT